MFFTHQRVLLQQREKRSAGPERTYHGRYGFLESAQQADETPRAAHQRASDAVREAGRRGRLHAPARHTPDDPGTIECSKHRLHLLLKYTYWQTSINSLFILFFFFFICIYAMYAYL